MAIPEYQFKLLSCNFIAPNVKHFIGQIETTEPFSFTAGQFITILFEHEEKILRRSYSIANPPDSQLIEFAASYVEGGPGSSYLFSRQPGDIMTVTGPFGRLILKSEVDYQRLFLIATSTGITPYRSMLQTLMNLRQHHPNCTIEIIQGVQKKEHILFAQDFIDFCQNQLNCHFSVALSRDPEAQQTTPFTIQHGHVQDILVKKNPNPATDLVYLCGNPKMIDDNFELLKNLGFSVQQIVREKYLSR
jgi:NAD(P)H-flavin reductase